MPEYGTRGMALIAEAGELPQPKQHGATSTRSKKNEYTSNCDELSRFYVTTSPTLLREGGGLVSGIGEQVNFNLISYLNIESVRLSSRVYVLIDGKYIQPSLMLKQCSALRGRIFMGCNSPMTPIN